MGGSVREMPAIGPASRKERAQQRVAMLEGAQIEPQVC